MNEKSNTKKSKRLVSAGVFIALYFVVFVIIGCCCMPVPPLYLCMTSLIALVAAPVYLMLLAKACTVPSLLRPCCPACSFCSRETSGLLR